MAILTCVVSVSALQLFLFSLLFVEKQQEGLSRSLDTCLETRNNSCHNRDTDEDCLRYLCRNADKFPPLWTLDHDIQDI